ncbi:MAG: diguanylate cyclase domain-containing protein [Wolinella sp.]
MSSEKAVKLQLLLLAFAMLVSLLLVGFMESRFLSHSYQWAKNLHKQNYETILGLERLDSLIGAELAPLILRAKSGTIKATDSSARINSLHAEISMKWSEYEARSTLDRESDIRRRAKEQIDDTSIRIMLIYQILESAQSVRIQSLSNERIFEMISRTQSVLRELINSEESHVKLIENEAQDEQAHSIKVIWLTLSAILLVISALFIFIGRGIAQNYRQLDLNRTELKKANMVLKELAIKDALTSVYNRRFFDIIFEREIEHSIEAHTSLTFIMIDIDHFKLYNDTYGHQEGDEALKRVAKTLDTLLNPPEERFFRLGGEEFGALALGLNEEESLALCTKMLNAIEGLKIPHKRNSAAPFVTISMGAVCLIPAKINSPQEIIESADKALYNAKEWGRNQAAIISFLG